MADTGEGLKFKTPKELGITEKQFCALVKVADGLQTGKLVHAPNTGRHPTHDGFNMRVWETRTEDCGTVCCIGGWSQRFGSWQWPMSAIRAPLEGGDNGGLNRLFYPFEVMPMDNWHRITPQQASRAITNYLTTGDPQWKKALGGDTESR